MEAKLQALLGKRIRQFRAANGLTIEELAFRAQLHPNYLGDVERGRRNPSLVNLNKIADGLGRPLADLFPEAHKASAVSQAREKTAVYFSTEQEKDLLSLIRILRNNSRKDRKRIIQIARSLSARLKSS